MGHIVFLVLHLLAILLGFVLLFVTIPAHLIYSAARSRRSTESDRGDTTRCPTCREVVRRDASRCKHCGETLVPSKVTNPMVWRLLDLAVLLLVLGFVFGWLRS